MITTGNTTIQTPPVYSKKVTDMILYAVAREMAKKIIATQAEENQREAASINKRKKANKQA